MFQPTIDSCLRNLQGTITKLSFSLMNNQPEIDKCANGRDDYQAILMTRAWKAMMRWRSEPTRVCQGPKAEQLYVYSTLWNSLRDLERSRRAKRLDATVYPLFDSDLIDEQFENRMVIRLDTSAVIDRVSAQQWTAFSHWLTNGVCGRNTTIYRHCKIVRERLQKNLVDCVMSY